MMQYEDIVYSEDIETHVATIEFRRPDKHNALRLRTYSEIADAIDRVNSEDDIKVVILTGAGPSFSSGQDLDEVGSHYGFRDDRGDDRPPSQRRRLTVDKEWSRCLSTIAYCSKVTIASVRGHCLGSGFDIAMSSDIVVAADDSRFGHPGRRIAGPGLGFNTVLWFWRLGPGLAKYMALTGDTLSGKEAGDAGLAAEVVPERELADRTQVLAEQIGRMPGDGIVMGKASFQLAADIAGIGLGYSYGYVLHTLGTNIQYDEDEVNFFRDRSQVGTKEAVKQRDSRFGS